MDLSECFITSRCALDTARWTHLDLLIVVHRVQVFSQSCSCTQRLSWDKQAQQWRTASSLLSNVNCKIQLSLTAISESLLSNAWAGRLLGLLLEANGAKAFSNYSASPVGDGGILRELSNGLNVAFAAYQPGSNTCCYCRFSFPSRPLTPSCLFFFSPLQFPWLYC